MRSFWSVFLASLLLIMSGCSNDDSSSAPAPLTSGAETDSAGDSPDSGPKAANDAQAQPKIDAAKLKRDLAVPERDSLTGRWLVCVFRAIQDQKTGMQFGEVPELIVSVTVSDQEPAGGTIAIAATRDSTDTRELKLTRLAETEIEFDCVDVKTGNKLFDYQGRFDSGRVIGTIQFANGELLPVRLVPTDERTFARVPQFIQLEEQLQFGALPTSAVPDEDTIDFAKEFPLSPLVRVAFMQLLENMSARRQPEMEVNAILEKFMEWETRWGKRMQLKSSLDVAQVLIVTGFDLEYCTQMLDRVEKSIEEAGTTVAGGQRRIDNSRSMLRLRRAVELLDAKKEEEKAQGRELARELLKETPFHPLLVSRLADEARDSKRIDEALQWYAELAVFPQQEAMLRTMWAGDPVQHTLPTERVAQLWKEKHGSSKGLDEFLDSVYSQSLLSFAGDAVTTRPNEDANRVVLVELFTGARCPQCVCADVAVAGIEKIYPTSMVIALRYHQHIPGQDPLTNEDGEQRFFNYYRRSGTPSLIINGKEPVPAGGPLSMMREVFPAVRKAIDEDLAKSTPTKIELTAAREDSLIRIAVNVTGDLSEGRKRLRLALAEEDVHFLAANGVRHHNMIVRQLIGGERGIAPLDGVLKYEGEVNVSELKNAMQEYLTKYEKNQSVEFPEKPLDLKSLVIVAFVQDDETKEVLQVAAVPVK